MRIAVASAIIAAVIAGCAQFGSHAHTRSQSVPGTRSGPPIEPEALRRSDSPTRNDLVVLLPKPNGRIGGVVVRTASGKQILLDKAYAGAHIDGPDRMQPVEYDASRMKREFSPVMAALPGRPVAFLFYFLEGKDELTPDSDREVGRVFAEIAARPYPEILVIGHTDAVGTAQHNDKLSLQRAERVRDELIRLGMPEDSIAVEGRGKREPLVNTPDGVAEQRNRRVEIEVR